MKKRKIKVKFFILLTWYIDRDY